MALFGLLDDVIDTGSRVLGHTVEAGTNIAVGGVKTAAGVVTLNPDTAVEGAGDVVEGGAKGIENVFRDIFE